MGCMKNRLSTLLLLSTLASGSVLAAAPGRLPFIEDDYARARAEASKRGVPLYIEVWAPW
jgi:hypothetical protein